MNNLGLPLPFREHGSNRISPKNLRSKSDKLSNKKRKKFSWAEVRSQDPDQIARECAEKESESERKHARTNKFQKTFALETLSEYFPRTSWRSDGNDIILVVGCANGAVTEDVLEPLLPQDYKRLLALILTTNL